MLYNISFDICGGVITLVALYTIIFRRDLERFSNRILFAVILMHFVAIVFDIWSSICNSYTADHSKWIRDLTNYSFLGVHCSEAPVFFWFLMVQLGVSDKMKQWQHMLLWLPELLLIIMPLLFNPFLKEVFYYDELDFYHHGSMMSLLYAGADLYMILCIIFVMWKRERMTRLQRRAALALLLLSTVPMLIQSMIMPKQLIEMFFQALGLYGYLLAVENIDESRHPVTHEWNRHALIRDFAYQIVSGTTMYAVIVKVSQIETLRIAQEGSAMFHRIRLRLCEWFEEAARPKNMKFYDCEHGIYAVLFTGAPAKEKCDDFCSKCESRFEQSWSDGTFELRLPVLVSKMDLLQSGISAQDFLSMVSRPYVHTQEDTVLALLRSFAMVIRRLLVLNEPSAACSLIS